MKKIMFFDTETTGLSPLTDSIIQFGAIYGSLDETTNEFYEERIINQFINTDVEIWERAFAVHGISKDKISNFGYMEEYIKEILAYLRKTDLIVGHNLKYDLGMLEWECRKLDIKNATDGLSTFCTMVWSTHICKIPRGGGSYKSPKLVELHQYLFGNAFDDAHDALADIKATKDCFMELMKRGEIPKF